MLVINYNKIMIPRTIKVIFMRITSFLNWNSLIKLFVKHKKRKLNLYLDYCIVKLVICTAINIKVSHLILLYHAVTTNYCKPTAKRISFKNNRLHFRSRDKLCTNWCHVNALPAHKSDKLLLFVSAVHFAP